MSTILDDIVAKRKEAVDKLRYVVPPHALERMPLFAKPGLSLASSLKDTAQTGIVAEFKRASPSRGIINNSVSIAKVAPAYASSGATGISILTEPFFFKGSNDDVLDMAFVLNVPILRKDFIIDEYQVLETKAIGADVMLLIAACLTPQQVKQFAVRAKQAGLEVLLEIHHEKELDHICEEIDMIGINNRDLKTFQVDIEISLRLINKIPTSKPAISESGITDAGTIVTLKQAGFRGFLIGETFMKETDPAIAFAGFVEKLKAKADERTNH